jgi:hypothetical protein
MSQQRGELTSRIMQEAKELLGYEITQEELRLMPYIMHLLINSMSIDPRKINAVEREILSKWRHAGYFYGGASDPVEVSSKFYSILCRILWLGYIDTE